MYHNKKKVLFFIFFATFAIILLTYGINNRIDNINYENTQIDNAKKYVCPGGQAIGIELKTKGVLVVGLADIVNSHKVTTSPAKKSGMRIGDKIISIDSTKINTTRDILNYSIRNGVKEYNFGIERNGKKFNVLITPSKSYNEEDVKFGFWARDNVAGIGTVTYVDPENYSFSAIGHGISDADTGNMIDIESGKISKANITNIKSGKKGEPGEIIGYILKDGNELGDVESNTCFGIHGTVNNKGMKFFKNDLIEVGGREDIRLGDATILSCVDNEIREYKIDIIKLYNQNTPAEKSFIIKIVDEDLLELTNGIIQGMSGSPIIQDNKLVGAVTHVFMNDPTKGYGIYIQWLFDGNYKTPSNL